MRGLRSSAVLRTLVVAAAVTGLSSCGGSSGATADFSVVHMKSPSGQAEILLRPRTEVVGLVVFDHGYGGNQNQILKAGTLRPLRDALAQAGYAIAASESHGNNFGDPASVQDQSDLVHDAESQLPFVNRVEVIGFSMGGVDALLTASEHAVPDLKSVVLLSAVCNQIPFLTGQLGRPIRAAFGNRKGQALLAALSPSDPERRDPHSYVGYRYWFWQSPQDRTVPPVQAASMIAWLHSAGADVRFSLLNGPHGDLKELTPGRIVDFFGS
jgi:pimeloyl-ACP methyl ester carboxylesterase